MEVPDNDELPPEIQQAYKEGQARGVPEGWTVTIDKRNRRKWTAPNGRSCDSIPKAIAISVELGLLPSDTVIPSGNRKRSVSAQNRAQKKQKNEQTEAKSGGVAAPAIEEESEDDDDDDVDEPPPEPLDPEVMLDGLRRAAAPTTVHWDPHSVDGRKIGWKIKIGLKNNNVWYDGRVTRFDPYSHKHKIEFDHAKRAPVWIWLRNEEHNLHLGVRMVWAHVKGYAWWPALVVESSSSDDRKDGFVNVEFFSSGEVSLLRDSSDCIREFVPDAIDPVVAKHKKKRNARAFQMACEEYETMRAVRNEAAIFYARKAIVMANLQGDHLIGSRVQIFRSDANYPYGDTVNGRVRCYSSFQKKWLVSFEVSDKTKNKYEAAWISLHARDLALRVLDKKKKGEEPVTEELVPYLSGFQCRCGVKKDEIERDRVNELCEMLSERCRGCLEIWTKDETRVTCEVCQTSCHFACFDPPLPYETWQRMLNEGPPIICPRCTPCRGCHQKDLVFGSHLHPTPPCLSLPSGDALYLCSMCSDAYDSERFCPNCSHSWDDVKFEKVRRQIEYTGGQTSKKKNSGIDDGPAPISFGSFTGDDAWPQGATVDPSWYYPETSEWGYTEVEMLVCDSCKVWVHAGCSGIQENEYNLTSDGKHPIYSKEYLCRVCCRKRCFDIIEQLGSEDKHSLFAAPVADKVAPNYSDVIKQPMDLQTMRERAKQDEYLNYAWVRELFELMVLNALTFNRFYTKVWIEASRFYSDSIKNVFAKIGKAAPSGRYNAGILANIASAEDAQKKELDRIQIDESVEKKDLVAGSMATTVMLPPLRDVPPDEESCVSCTELTMKSSEAFYCSWMDCCFTCGSSGAADTFLFCVDCGEAYHSFCANAPIRSMDASSVAGWRCPNCKICEICADVPKDDSRLVFCEMCDRAFTLDLLDPPLPHAPSGLWVCGQCVDCQSCKGGLEPLGASLRHWSCDPDKCYRCGGCRPLLADSLVSQCIVCLKFLRNEDEENAECRACGTRVHAQCDILAGEHIRMLELASRSQKAQKKKSDEYTCSNCYQPKLSEDESTPLGREELLTLAWEAVGTDLFKSDDHYSKEAKYAQLVDRMDWVVRDMWRDEYLEVVQIAVRACEHARNAFGDPRIVVQYVLNNTGDLPRWLGQRALRFLLIARREKWGVANVDIAKIESLVHYAKLASAFLRVAAHSLGINLKADLACYSRIEKLLEALPGPCETVTLPFDTIKDSKDSAVAAAYKAEAVDRARGVEHSSLAVTHDKPMKKANDKPILAQPLCGWPREVGGEDFGEWRDPRECCLCHVCGDDDAGTLDMQRPAVCCIDDYLCDLGRLLPMPNGFWVHTSCALWSSEVWEKASDGLIHAADKARGRGAQLKCFGCGYHGATVGCNKSNCNFNYHFPCAKACGAVFTANQQVFCASHRSSATGILPKESYEFMKTLIIEGEKKTGEREVIEVPGEDMCFRIGSLVVHSFGKIETKADGFHTENYIIPPGYTASRIFWSTVQPRTRALYIMKVEVSPDGRAQFIILPGDSPQEEIVGSSCSSVYNTLMERIRKTNADCFSPGDLYSKRPMARRTRRKTYGLNGPQFFGYGLEQVRKLLESSPGVEAVVAPLAPTSPKYRFCYVQPSIEGILDLQRKRAAAQAEQALENSSGCARTEGVKAVTRSGGSGRITRALVRIAEEEIDGTTGGGNASTKKGEDKANADRNVTQVKYRRMKAVPIEERLVTRRSHIHGWGLFTKVEVKQDDPVVEYMGETIRQPVADKRERLYESSGEGSCYMFRLDLHRIVDATMIGCMARFMNHSCQYNSYARIITVDTDAGQERKIVVFASRNIAAGEEITYDYKFPVEDGSLRCTCGASNCIGRLN